MSDAREQGAKPTRTFMFITCPKCQGYGVLDSGLNCKDCGGIGRGGLRSGRIGSGEIIIDSATGKRVSVKEFNSYHGVGNETV